MIRKYALLLVCLCVSYVTSAQLTDIARIEYTYFPQDQSENSFKRFRAFVNAPIQVSEDGYVVVGFEFRNVFVKLDDPNLLFDPDNKEQFYNYTATAGYTDKWNDKWRYAFQIEFRAASNFFDGLQSEDIIIGGSGYVIRDATDVPEGSTGKPWRLIVGLNYSTTAGRPFPLPFINYYREFHPKWTYTLGVPKSNVKYEFVPNMKLQGFITLDGFFANIQQNVVVADDPNRIGSNISMTTLLSGLGYEWEFIDHFVFYVYAGHTILNDIRLRDKDGNDVYTINDTNNFYGRGGFKIKI